MSFANRNRKVRLQRVEVSFSKAVKTSYELPIYYYAFYTTCGYHVFVASTVELSSKTLADLDENLEEVYCDPEP